MSEQATFAGMDNWMDSEEIVPKSGRKLTLRYNLVQTQRELDDMGELLCGIRDIAHDTETSGLNVHLGARIIGHAFAAQTDTAELTGWYIPIRHINTSEHQLDIDAVSDVVQLILESEGRAGYHHMKFDQIMCRADDIAIAREMHDTSILATIANENERYFGLKPLAAKYILDSARNEQRELDNWMRSDARKLKMNFKKRDRGSIEDVDTLGEPTYMDRFGFARTPIYLCGRYACKDVIYTLYLWLLHFRNTPAEFPQVYQRERRISQILHEMEWVGLPVDEKAIREAHDKTGTQLLYWLNECRRFADDKSFEATDDQIRDLLFNRMRMEPPKWTKGGQKREPKQSVDKEARELLKRQYPEHINVLHAISRLAEIEKVHSTYSGNFLRYYDKETGRIYPNYNQLEQRDEGGFTVTGRLSSQNPNIQNISRDSLKLEDGTEINIKKYFTVPVGYIRVYIDFNQIELKVLAWFSQDPNLLRAYREGLDVHQMTADLLGIARAIAKQVNFGNSYGMTEVGLSLRIPGYYDDPEGTREKARKVLAAFFRQYSSIKVFQSRLANEMRKNNCMFINPFGRPRRIPDISNFTDKWARERAERQMMSSIISGTAADLMKECMIRTYDILREDLPGGELVQSIHDELIFDLPLSGPWAHTLIKIIRAMEDWPMFSEAGPNRVGGGVPITVSCELTSTTWADKKKIKLTPDNQFYWA